MTPRCRECGGKIAEGATFCPHCGRQAASRDRGEPESGQEKKRRLRAELMARSEAGESLRPQGRRTEAKASSDVAQTKRIGIRDALLGLTLLLLLSSFVYSASVHLWARNRIDYLEKAVYGETSVPLGEGDSVADTVAKMTEVSLAVDQRLTKLEEWKTEQESPMSDAHIVVCPQS